VFIALGHKFHPLNLQNSLISPPNWGFLWIILLGIQIKLINIFISKNLYHFGIFLLGRLYGLKLEALALMKVTWEVELNVRPILIKPIVKGFIKNKDLHLFIYFPLIEREYLRILRKNCNIFQKMDHSLHWTYHYLKCPISKRKKNVFCKVIFNYIFSNFTIVVTHLAKHFG